MSSLAGTSVVPAETTTTVVLEDVKQSQADDRRPEKFYFWTIKNPQKFETIHTHPYSKITHFTALKVHRYTSA